VKKLGRLFANLLREREEEERVKNGGRVLYTHSESKPSLVFGDFSFSLSLHTARRDKEAT